MGGSLENLIIFIDAVHLRYNNKYFMYIPICGHIDFTDNIK